MPNIEVMGVVPNRDVADQVIGNCRLAGFPQDALSVVTVHQQDPEKIENADDQTGEGIKDVAGSLAKGAGIGGAAGVALGAAALAIPGIGPVIGSGILMGIFGVSGAYVGGLVGAFANQNTSEQVINRYGMALREGNAIICVTAPDTDHAKQAEELLNRGGATNVNSYFAENNG